MVSKGSHRDRNEFEACAIDFTTLSAIRFEQVFRIFLTWTGCSLGVLKQCGARRRNRTVTSCKGPGILSPVRLPVSPSGRIELSLFYIQRMASSQTECEPESSGRFRHQPQLRPQLQFQPQHPQPQLQRQRIRVSVRHGLVSVRGHLLVSTLARASEIALWRRRLLPIALR
jgi:hypothetical protein